MIDADDGSLDQPQRLGESGRDAEEPVEEDGHGHEGGEDRDGDGGPRSQMGPAAPADPRGDRDGDQEGPDEVERRHPEQTRRVDALPRPSSDAGVLAEEGHSERLL